MTGLLRLMFVTLVVLFVAGCARTMVPIYEVDDTYIIGRSLADEQIKEAILEGAQTAGWNAKVLPDEIILAIYRLRNHTVHVEIFYTDKYYALTYKSSSGMKVYCNARDRDKLQNMKISGGSVWLAAPSPGLWIS